MIEIEEKYFNEQKEKAGDVYKTCPNIYCPYFGGQVILNSDGFHHIQFSARRERPRQEQLLKFHLLPLALEVVRKSGTIQEYRKLLSPVGKRSAIDNSIPMKEIEYWAFIAIIGEQRVKIKAIVRRVGDGNHVFWSVMLHSKRKNGKQRLYSEGIEDEE